VSSTASGPERQHDHVHVEREVRRDEVSPWRWLLPLLGLLALAALLWALFAPRDYATTGASPAGTAIVTPAGGTGATTGGTGTTTGGTGTTTGGTGTTGGSTAPGGTGATGGATTGGTTGGTTTGGGTAKP
jgi:hypothetical protein